MPHYQDGTEAKVGDRVRGTGYNPQSRGYDPEKGIEGIVTDVRAGSNERGACTLTVAFLTTPSQTFDRGDGVSRSNANCFADGIALRMDIEYGDTVGFTKVG
jgi:hypothetical protein